MYNQDDVENELIRLKDNFLKDLNEVEIENVEKTADADRELDKIDPLLDFLERVRDFFKVNSYSYKGREISGRIHDIIGQIDMKLSKKGHVISARLVNTAQRAWDLHMAYHADEQKRLTPTSHS